MSCLMDAWCEMHHMVLILGQPIYIYIYVCVVNICMIIYIHT